MASNALSHTDPNVFGGELGKLIVRYGELTLQDNEAKERLAAAQQAVKDAEATGIAQAAAARVTGEDTANSAESAESEAKRELELAEREARIAAAAVYTAGEAIEYEAVTGGDAYRAKLDKRIEASSKTGQNALAKLEDALADIRVARAYRSWLERPGTASGPQLRELFAGESSIRTANGEPLMVSTLTASVHNALTQVEFRQGDQRGGIAVGAVREAA